MKEEDYDEQVLICPLRITFFFQKKPYKLGFSCKETSHKLFWDLDFLGKLFSCLALDFPGKFADFLSCMAKPTLQANALIFRKVKQIRRQFSSFVNKSSHQIEETDETEPLPYNSSTWVPHPRTGIYFPQGHEWVMKDVPQNAASFSPVCWFRDSDGVDDLSLDAGPSPCPRFAPVYGRRD